MDRRRTTQEIKSEDNQCRGHFCVGYMYVCMYVTHSASIKSRKRLKRSLRGRSKVQLVGRTCTDRRHRKAKLRLFTTLQERDRVALRPKLVPTGRDTKFNATHDRQAKGCNISSGDVKQNALVGVRSRLFRFMWYTFVHKFHALWDERETEGDKSSSAYGHGLEGMAARAGAGST